MKGTYEVNIPEEGALLVVAWLIENGGRDTAHTLLDELAPFFARLRFYPRPAKKPRRFGSRVYVQDVDTTIKSLHAIRANQRIATQQEAIEVWTPLYDELIALFLDTVDGPPPSLRTGADGEVVWHENGRFAVEGGWPCQIFADNWCRRAADSLQRFDSSRKQHQLSSKARHPKSSLAQLSTFVPKCLTTPRSSTGREVGRIRLLLARYTAKRGLPGSAKCRLIREQQNNQAQTPVYQRVAAAIVPRLQHFPGNEGIEDLIPVTKPITNGESAKCGVKSGQELPDTIRRKIERCLCASIEVLVERGLIPSGDVLAKVLPQLTSQLRATGITDPSLRQLYAAIYRAFRRRRSLLLLDQQSQVRIEEMPWVAAIEQFRSDNLSTKELARQALEEVTGLAIVSFPYAMLPNKLLQELRALAKGAELDIPIVDELAADIFMGAFSRNFVQAAKQAANLLNGTLYRTYYGIDTETVLRLQTPARRRSWLSRLTPGLDEFAMLCCKRAGVKYSGWKPAINGMIIEQQQVLTTQNLASFFSAVQLEQTLRPNFFEMAQRCFDWICRRLQINEPQWHARLIIIKNSAYAWRQMVFYLSFLETGAMVEFIDWAKSHLSTQQGEFQTRFRPVIEGLVAASQGRTPPSGAPNHRVGRQFLGWSKTRHWLM